MHLDVPTLALVGFLVGTALSLNFTVLAVLLRGQRVLHLWALGFWFGTLGMSLIGLRHLVPSPVAVLAGNAFIAAANAMLLRGVAVHLGASLRWRWPLLLIGIFVTGQAWFAFVQPDLGMRMTAFSLQGMTWDLWMVWLLLRYGAHDIRRSRRFAAALLGLNSLVHFSRLFLPMAAPAGQDFMQAGLPLAAAYLSAIAIALSMSLALTLLLAERLIVDLGRQANTDGLTGLLNRAALFSEGARALSLCRRSHLPFSLLMFDLDHFKSINDSWGHDAGDAVLRHFTQVIRENDRRSSHVFGRYGGEEFLLVLPGANERDALSLAERLRTSVAASPASFEGRPIAFTTSIGIATACSDSGLQQLISEADGAMYRAKAAGRNRVEVWHDQLLTATVAEQGICPTP